MTAPQLPDQPMAVPRHVWRHTAEWSLAGALAAWVGLSPFHIPVPFLAATLILAGIITGFSVLKHTKYSPFFLYMAAWTVFLPGWVIYAHVRGQYHWLTAGILAAGTAILAVTGAHIWTNLLEELRQLEADDERRRLAEERAKWERLFTKLGVKGIKTSQVTETRAGEDVHLKLPATVRLARLQELTENIAIHCQLPEDSVSFERGHGHAGEVIMHINRKDVLATDIPFPALDGWLSVNKPIPVGMLADGRVMEVLMREVQVLVIGMTGMGKSNLMNVLTALLTRCPDAMVFMIEFKGGRLPAPWLRPWAEGKTPRPAIDWVATTRAEAETMIRAVERLSDARSASLRGGSKIDPDETCPQLIVLVDEASDVIGSGKLKSEQVGEGISNARMSEIGNRLVAKGRSEAVEMVWGTQRATVSKLGSGDLKSQSGLRFALRTASENDAQSIIPDDYAAARQLARLRHDGTGLVWRPGYKHPQPVKFYRLDTHDPADMNRTLQLAAEAGHRRPDFTPEDLEALGQDYTERWERSELLARLHRDIAPAAAPVAGAEPVAGPPRQPVAVIDEAAEFRRMTEGLGEMDIPDGVKRIHPSRARIHAWLAEKPHLGMGVLEMEAKLRHEPGDMTVRRETIHRWMRDDIDAGLVYERNHRYFMRRDRSQP